MISLDMYYTKDINFSLDIEAYESFIGGDIKIGYAIEAEINKADGSNNQFTVELTMTLNYDKSVETIPLKMKATVLGIFASDDEIENDVPDMVGFEASNLLYPYLRTVFLSMTSGANISPLPLPISISEFRK